MLTHEFFFYYPFQIRNMQVNHYQDAVDDRAAKLWCGYPLCKCDSQRQLATGNYRIEFSKRRVVDISESKVNPSWRVQFDFFGLLTL